MAAGRLGVRVAAVQRICSHWGCFLTCKMGNDSPVEWEGGFGSKCAPVSKSRSARCNINLPAYPNCIVYVTAKINEQNGTFESSTCPQRF